MTTSTLSTSSHGTSPSGTSPDGTETTGTEATGTAAAAWAVWHAEREDGLRPPHGWLSLVAYHWLPSEPAALPGVPGLWWADADGAHHRAADGGGAAQDSAVVRTPDGEPVTTVVVTEGGSSVAGTFVPARAETATATAADPADPDGPAGDAPETTAVAVEVVRRTGRYAIRLRDPLAPARAAFDGVPTFAYDPAWVVEATARWYDEPRSVVVGAARPGLVHHVSTVGEVDLEAGPDGDRRRATLVLTGKAGGAVTALFSDEADDVAPWRVLWVDVPEGIVPGEERRVRLDLNRTINLPYAFSDFGTCPAPVEGNHVPFAVSAGERAPR